MKLILTPLLAATLLFSGCDKDKKSTKDENFSQNAGFVISPKQPEENAEIKVFNQYGEPIEGAQILIGDAQGNPFRGNFITTDRLGSALIPLDWTTPASVTVDAAGYIRQTLLSMQPSNISIKLNKAYLPQYAEIRGNVTDLPVVNNDKLIDFALAMPLMKKTELLNLDLAQVISPYNDFISAAGQRFGVPSNISLPKQKESYIIGITLDKPVYRLKTPTLGPKKLVSIRGRFVFKSVVDQLRAGKAFYEVLNEITFYGGGTADAVALTPVTNVTIPGSAMIYNGQIQVPAIPVNADEIPIALAASEIDGFMIPTDVKRTVAGKVTTLQTLPNAQTYLINAVKRQSEFMANAPGADRITASAVPYQAGLQPKLLPLVANPSITNKENYIINLPAAPTTAGINPVVTSAIISDLVESREGDIVVLSPVRKWEVLGFGWTQQISLPKWPQTATERSAARKRVEINYVGTVNSTVGKNPADIIDSATHITHASTDF